MSPTSCATLWRPVVVVSMCGASRSGQGARRSYSWLRASLGSVFAAALQVLESIETWNWIGLGMACRDGDGLSHGKPSFIGDEAMSEAIWLDGLSRMADPGLGDSNLNTVFLPAVRRRVVLRAAQSPQA